MKCPLAVLVLAIGVAVGRCTIQEGMTGFIEVVD
jgi:hypothetical protein